MNKKSLQARLKIILPVAIALIVIGILVKYFFFREPFRYAGTVEATKVDVPARVTSVIQSIPVREGDTVKEGQVLLSLTCEDIRLNAAQAARDLARTGRLFKGGAAPQEEYERIKTQEAEARLKLEWCTVESPLNGTVLTRYREPGEQVGPGVKLFTVADLQDLWAYVYVAQPELVRLQVREKVRGYIPEIKRFVEGNILKINDEAEFTPKNVQTREERTRLVYGVKVGFTNTEGLLKPGMTVEVEL